MSRFCGGIDETVRIEPIRLGPEVGMTVNGVKVNKNKSPGLQSIAPQDQVTVETTQNHRCGRVEPHRLLQHCTAIGKPGEVRSSWCSSSQNLIQLGM